MSHDATIHLEYFNVWLLTGLFSSPVSVFPGEIMDEKMSYKEFLDRNDSWSAEERDLCFKPMDMAGRMAQGPGASLILAAGGPHGLLAGVHSHPFLAPSLWGLLLPCL